MQIIKSSPTNKGSAFNSSCDTFTNRDDNCLGGCGAVAIRSISCRLTSFCRNFLPSETGDKLDAALENSGTGLGACGKPVIESSR